MNISGKRTSRLLSLSLAGSMLIGLMTTGVSAAEPAQDQTKATVKDAILYTVDESGNLEYNVVYEAKVADGVTVTDSTEDGSIGSLDELDTVLGEPDPTPKELTGTPHEDRTLGDAVVADLTITGDEITAIEVTDVQERPVIGISWKTDDITNEKRADYWGFAEAFERNGAQVIFLPQVKTDKEAEDIFSRINGVFMTGGEDWNPDLYHEEAYPHGSSGWNDDRDTSDLHLMQNAIELDVPMLAVCRGEQGFNVAMGGGLIQDVPTYLGEQVKAGKIAEDRATVIEDTGIGWGDNKKPCDTPHYRVTVDGLVHSGGNGYHKLDTENNGIGIAADSKWLSSIFGGADSIDLIATAHHQSVDPKNLGKGLTVAARSSDGIIEAIEHRDSLFALGLQWHPERDALKDTRTDKETGKVIDVDQGQCNAPLRALVHYAGVQMDREDVPGSGGEEEEKPFQPSVTYEVTVTDEERAKIHAAVEELAGKVENMRPEENKNPNTLVGALAKGSSYDSISYGSRITSVEKVYPFKVINSEANHNEYDRKVAKLAWVKELGEALGLKVVQRQEDKYVYVEIGDPDAPEMVMALSHLDSPTGSIKPGGNLDRWVNYDGQLDKTAYHTPYVRDGWLYGAGVQDDSGPTLATLFAAKALQDSGVEFDRRIRIVMGCYEDGSPAKPSADETLSYIDIPYYSAPSFYDNWTYKALNREETPIAAYTSDSRFPVVVGNTRSWTPYLTMDLSSDAGQPFALVDTGAGVTLRDGDPTLKDIVYGSAAQIASRAIFVLDISNASEDDVTAFCDKVEEAATERGWLPKEDGKTQKVQLTEDKDKGTLTLEINTDVPMEYPMPMYSKNAVVWGMYLLSQALPEDLELKKAADGVSDLFFRNCEEGEAYIGKYMDIPSELLRNPNDGTANLTIAPMGTINHEDPWKFPFYKEDTQTLSIPLVIRSIHATKDDYEAATQAVIDACEAKGFELETADGAESVPTDFAAPSLYLTHDNPLTALQYASYKASIEYDPEEFSGPADLLGVTYPVGTTGGTLASDYQNKMTAFGAVIPGNERWWHSANERISVDSIVEMTKMMADGMLEMARYSGSAGAQLMWADLPGLNADRADLDLLDVTIGTYQDASDEITTKILDGDELIGATDFEIHMWAARGNGTKSQMAYDLGHEPGGVYLPLDDPDFLANTFVLPMRLEFKYDRPSDMSSSDWNALRGGDLDMVNFSLLEDGDTVALTLPDGADAEDYFSIRVDENDPDTVYVAANLAIVDGEQEFKAVTADSKTDLFKLNDEWLKTHKNPFPERGQIEERGFFLFGDGEKNACFESPEAIFATLDADQLDDGDDDSSSGGSDNERTYDVSVSKADNGSVKANASSASAGTRITVTVKPDSGYELDELTVTDAKGKDVKVTKRSETTYTFQMPDSKVTVEAAFAKDGTAVDQPLFSDVSKNNYFYDAVEWAVDKGITSGTGGTTFSPNASCTRGQMVTFLWRAAGSPAPKSAETPFTDVNKGDYFYDAVLWAVEQGITSGTSATTFSPNATVTRGQTVTFLWRAAGSPAASGSSFSDVSADAYYAQAVAWAVKENITAGTSASTFSPDAHCTRAQIVTFLWKDRA